MSSFSENSSLKAIWKKLIGDPEEYSLENRAFNYVCVISFILLVLCVFANIYISQATMTWVLLFLIAILSVIYYLGKVRKRYTFGVIVFAVCSYGALILNYFLNSGTYGPTIELFFVSFVLLITISDKRYHILWIVLHLIILITMIWIEYYNPALVPDTYPDKNARFIDLSVNVLIGIAFIYSVTRHLRNFYDAKTKEADERSLAIVRQNEEISAQNERLEQVDNEKNKLFSIISHDLKSPLDSIKGFLEMLSGNMLDENERQVIQAELLEQTKYTADLLMNLMTWAKSQMHGVTVNLSVQNLRDFVEDVAKNKISIAARKGIKLTYSISPSIEVICDRDMLHIVLRNLVNNAIKFTNTGGEVSVAVKTTADKVIVSVKDTGIGIPPEMQAGLFTLKTRSTYGTNREKGIGLGLLMCKEYMDYQMGDIWFESEYGKGSTFFISLSLTKH